METKVEEEQDSSLLNDLSRSLFNTIPDPFFVVGEDGMYLEVLGGTERTLYDDGIPLRGQNIYTFMPKMFADLFMEQVRHTLDIGRLNTFDYQLETDDVSFTTKNGPGGMQWFEARMYPLERPYKGQRAVTVMIINITERRNLHKQLRDLSNIDPLTGLYNRRYFLQRVSLHLREAGQAHILICDIDHFKVINDTHGHLAGDAVLQEFANRAKEVVKHSKAIARYGGDEFVVAVTNKSDDEAVAIAEELRIQVARKPFLYQDLQLNVHISVGIARIQGPDFFPTSLISKADIALYKAKEAGRNQVCLFSEDQ
ncbi:MAG: GGDEF domain-containing protein [Sphaerochaetaceae bacterium]